MQHVKQVEVQVMIEQQERARTGETVSRPLPVIRWLLPRVSPHLPSLETLDLAGY